MGRKGGMLGYLRFGGGLPHYRLDRMQSDLGVRLPERGRF